MFGFDDHSGPPPKCFLTHGLLPRFVDPEQPPSAKKPFSVILDQSFSHSVDCILPEELYTTIWQQIEDKMENVRFSRVILPLSALLEADFFNVYIKTGNIAMLSEGRPGIDPLYSFQDGILKLELPKELYEMAGLAGKPISDGGRKHIKTRYAIEINLRQPSMVHGRKGFERLVAACKNVLTASLTWLFFDYESPKAPVEPGTTPLSAYHPKTKVALPATFTRKDVLIPPIQAPDTSDRSIAEEDALDVLEWLHLVALDSPRVRASDSVDPHLCRYSLPYGHAATAGDVVCVHWKGLLPETWIRELFLQCLSATRDKPEAWFALNAWAFEREAVDGKQGYTLLKLPKDKATVKDMGDDTAVVDAAADDDANPMHGMQSKKTKGKRKLEAAEYLLWEMTSGSTGHT